MLSKLFLLFLISSLAEVAHAACALGNDVISLKSWTGGFASPGQDRKLYPNDQKCLWEIRVSQGSRINVTFTSFNLEEGYSDSTKFNASTIQCPDAVKITDPIANEVLFEGCGQKGAGLSFLSTGNTIQIVFNSDENNAKEGFAATYSGICESDVTQETILETPNYPSPPLGNVSCRWNVTSLPGFLTLVRSDVNDTNTKALPADCQVSPLKWSITDGVNISSQVLCGTDSLLVVTRNDFMLTYNPNSSQTTQPWTGRLLLEHKKDSVEASSCALGNDVTFLKSWTGTFASPGQDKNLYPNDQKCMWEIRVSQGSRVNLTFETFTLEEGYFDTTNPDPDKIICPDAVKIADDVGKKVLFDGCGNSGAGSSFLSSGNTLQIVFYSDGNNAKAGFAATYHGVCESDVTKDTELETPNYPYPPPDGVTCQWNVTSLPSHLSIVRPDVSDTNTEILRQCDDSPVKWTTTDGIFSKNKVMCRNDSLVISKEDVLLTYDPIWSNTSQPWFGRLLLQYKHSGNISCHDFCQHTDTCLSSRTTDPTDYGCSCKSVYSGRNCEIYTDPCLNQNCSDRGKCLTSMDGENFTCECEPFTTGAHCEVEIDPCSVLTCLNQGTCIADNKTAAHCECPADWYLLPDCREPPKPCQAQPCLHRSTCVDISHDNFTCICQPAYIGRLCSIVLGQAHCIGETDSIAGSQIAWKDTIAGLADIQPCPKGITGNATRNCIEDDQSSTGGLWTRPDLSSCVSPALMGLVQLAQQLRDNKGFEEEHMLLNITRRLDNVTSSVKDPNGPTLYPGDLLSASQILSDVSKGIANIKMVEKNALALVWHFTSSIDNILNPTAAEIWINARAQLVEAKIASLVESAQRFVQNFIRHHPGISVMNRDSQSPSGRRTIFSSVATNLDLQVTSWPDQPNSSLSPAFSGSNFDQPSSISLPPEIVTIAHRDTPGRAIRLYTARFTSIAPLLSLKESRYSRKNETNITKIVNSDVISAEVLDVPKYAFSKLTEPVKITLRLSDLKKRPELKKFCVFMNLTASDADERWLDDGCYVDNTNETHVTCFCYHMTNFAVLLDVYDVEDAFDENNKAALSYISYIGGSLSIISCVCVIVIFEYFRLRSDRIRIHQHLAVSITSVQILFLIGLGRTEADDTTPMWACKAVAILLHFALTALFCWMLVEGIHIYVMLVKVFKRGSHLKKYCAIGWGVPFIVVGISVGVFFDKYGNTDLCWLNHELLLICFVPTVCLVVVINTVILILVLRVMLKSLHSTAKVNVEEQSSIRMSLKASAVLLPLLGLTWTLGFLMVDVGDSNKVVAYTFTYLFTLTNSFQGVLFFVFHCLLNVDVHNAYDRRYRQKKRPLSCLETTIRKSSEISSCTTDASGKSTTKTNFSDTSLTPRRPSIAHINTRFLDNDNPSPFDPLSTSGSSADRSSVFTQSIGTASDHVSSQDSMQVKDADEKDTDFILRGGCSVDEQTKDKVRHPPLLHPSTTYSTSQPDLTAFVDSLYDILDSPRRRILDTSHRNNVHFS